MPHRLRGVILAAESCDGGGEEILELEGAARGGDVLVGGDAADRRFVQLHLLGDVAQRQGPQVLDPLLEEGRLLPDDLGRHLEDRGCPLVQRLDQPVGLLQALRQIVAVLAVASPGAHRGVVAAVDQDPRQGVRVELDAPGAVGPGQHQDVRNHRLGGLVVEGLGRLGVELADLGHHVGHVLGIDAAKLHQLRQLAPGQQVQVVQQGPHGRVQAVAFSQLQRQALRQAAGEDAGRVETLQDLQDRLDPFLRTAQGRGQLGQGPGDVARLVQQVDQVQADQPVHWVRQLDCELLQQVLPERRFLAEPLIQALAVVRRRAAATRGAGQVAEGAVGRAVVVKLLRVRVERRLRLFGHLVGRGQAGGILVRRCRLVFRKRGVRLGVAPLLAFQKRVRFELAFDEFGQLDVRQLQQLDRLLQLRRHHKAL